MKIKVHLASIIRSASETEENPANWGKIRGENQRVGTDTADPLPIISSLASRRYCYNFEIIFELISRIDIYLSLSFPGKCLLVNASRPHWWSANSGSGNGLVLSSNKPLPEPILTQISITLWLRSATMSWFTFIQFSTWQDIDMVFEIISASLLSSPFGAEAKTFSQALLATASDHCRNIVPRTV